MKYILAIVVMFAVVGCTDPESARSVLEVNGFTDIQFTGYNVFACGEGDFYHTGFTAKGPTGKFASGTVCKGMFFKNSTVRFE